jgi:hypothetical protein
MVQKEDKGSFYGISPANCMWMRFGIKEK